LRFAPRRRETSTTARRKAAGCPRGLKWFRERPSCLSSGTSWKDGLEIIPLQIKLRVYRHKPVKVEKQIPLTLKPGEYDIECRFHPRHVPAKLVVKEKAP
jgi:hypothetical protein